MSISGVTARWGFFTLFAGLALLAIAAQISTGRLVAPSRTQALAIGGGALGILSLGLALYVGFSLRDAIAESETGTSTSEKSGSSPGELDEAFDDFADDFAKGLEELLAVGTGAGVYMVGVGGILSATGAGLALRRKDQVG